MLSFETFGGQIVFVQPQNARRLKEPDSQGLLFLGLNRTKALFKRNNAEEILAIHRQGVKFRDKSFNSWTNEDMRIYL